MNNKDLDAFNEWRNSTSTRLDIHDAWQTACEYKNKELMEWKEAARSEAEEVNRLQAENKKLREALEKIATIRRKDGNDNEYVGPEVWTARQALKEVEDK